MYAIRSYYGQAKNFFLTLLVSLGTPMILMGDEARRTQRGNNNAYCQDNELSWMDWGCMERNAEVLRFVREAIAFRRRHQAFLRPEFLTGAHHSSHVMPDVAWFGPDGKGADWASLDRFIAYRLMGTRANIAQDCDENDFLRITSYNVCYTKLLRPSGPNQATSGMTWEEWCA